MKRFISKSKKTHKNPRHPLGVHYISDIVSKSHSNWLNINIKHQNSSQKWLEIFRDISVCLHKCVSNSHLSRLFSNHIEASHLTLFWLSVIQARIGRMETICKELACCMRRLSEYTCKFVAICVDVEGDSTSKGQHEKRGEKRSNRRRRAKRQTQQSSSTIDT